MATRKSSIFYGTLIALSSLVVGMVLAARLDLTPGSLASMTGLNVPAANSAPLTGPIDATTFRTVAHDASPAVVSILVSGKRNVPDMEDFFGFQLPPQFQPRRNGRNAQPQEPMPTQQRPFTGAGSGFIIDKTGYILTNNHVIDGADEIRVVLSTMTNTQEGLAAKVVGRDVYTDSALLQLTETPKEALVEATFGDSDQIAPGDWVMAIGNPYMFSNSVTVGVVSGVGRVSPDLNPTRTRALPYIQTDAAINHGNSGGPLLNIRGEVVGINTAILSEGAGPNGGGNIGLGFAVPINTIRNILPQLRSGKVTRGRIGIFLDPTPLTAADAKALGLSSAAGVVVSRLEDGGPAKAAGLLPGDVIVEFDGKAVKTNDELVAVVSATTPGTPAPVKLVRGGKTMTLSVKVAELSPTTEQAAADAGQPAHTDAGFGMSLAPLSPAMSRAVPGGRGGAVVADVESSSSAARSGMHPNDVILKVGGKDVSNIDQVTSALKTVGSGQTIPVVVWRPGQDGDTGAETFVLLRKR